MKSFIRSINNLAYKNIVHVIYDTSDFRDRFILEQLSKDKLRWDYTSIYIDREEYKKFLVQDVTKFFRKISPASTFNEKTAIKFLNKLGINLKLLNSYYAEFVNYGCDVNDFIEKRIKLVADKFSQFMDENRELDPRY